MQVRAIQGDTVDALCHRHYGRTVGVVEAVLAANPGLADLGPILPNGTAVELPDIDPAEQPQTTNIIKLWD